MNSAERMKYREFADIIRAADSRLSGIAQTGRNWENEIREACRALQEEKAFSLLKSIPIAEINSAKEGIRVGALEKAGITTIADALRQSRTMLTRIPGIGPEMADKIRRNAEAIRQGAMRKAKVSLSESASSPAERKLLKALDSMMYTRAVSERAEKLYRGTHEAIRGRLMISECIGNGLKWFFTGSREKQQAELAYSELKDYLVKYYGKEANSIIQEYNKASERTEAGILRDFGSNSAPYYSLLENVCEREISFTGTYGGIPEELASEIDGMTLKTEELHAELRKYQLFGAKYAIHQKRVLLGDEMGLGKTIQAIAVMVHLYACEKKYFLVVCPLSVLVNWQREIARFSDIPVDDIYGYDREEEREAFFKNGGIAVTTFETATKLELPDGIGLDLLVVDEAHFTKNPEAQRTRAVRNLAARSEYVLFMSGTPLENKVEEMSFLISALQPEISRKTEHMTSLAQAPAFRETIAPVYLRRTREEVLTELPELQEVEEWGTLNAEETAAYREALRSENFMELRRISWNVAEPEKSTKGVRLLELVNEAWEDGRKVLVFSYFKKTLEMVSEMLGERCIGIIDGSMSMEKRQQLLDEFAKEDTPPVLAAQVVAGGVGLNIQCASVIIFCEPQMKPSMEEQAIGRAYRMGQNRNVLVHRLLISDSVDEKIMELLKNKRKLFDEFAEDSVIGNAAEEITITTAMADTIIEEEKKRLGITDAEESGESKPEVGEENGNETDGEKKRSGETESTDDAETSGNNDAAEEASEAVIRNEDEK